MVVTSDIQFENNPNAIFYAGQVINGKVTLTADKVKQVKAVVLKITGSAESRWSETTGTGDKRKTVTYSGKEDYINSVTYLMTPTTSDQSVVIEPGIHTFSFACHLPANCPSSFEGYIGNIRYIVQVNLERPWKFDQKFTKPFTVLNVMNLNYNNPVLGTFKPGVEPWATSEYFTNFIPKRGYFEWRLALAIPKIIPLHEHDLSETTFYSSYGMLRILPKLPANRFVL